MLPVPTAQESYEAYPRASEIPCRAGQRESLGRVSGGVPLALK
jgi:hypothetical protein